MTGFCGVILRERQESHAGIDLKVVQMRAEQVLSRHEEDDVQSFSKDGGFLCFFDNGAWQSGRTIVDMGSSVAVLSGSPLMVKEDGAVADPASDMMRVCAALVSGDDSALQSAKGSFAAAAWDPTTSRLRLCADKLALRPIYLYLDNELCIFATSIRVLRALARAPLGVHERGLAETLYLGQCLGNRTVYQNVTVLAPGEIVSITPSAVERRVYYDWCDVPATCLDEAQTIETLYQQFNQAVRRRSRSQTEDAFLSGGLDSRCVVAGLLDAGRAVRSFGSSYPESADDVISRMAAAAFGTIHFPHQRNPSERLKLQIDSFALYAAANFPPQAHGPASSARTIWSGDGGSVGMGHVYMNQQRVQSAAEDLDDGKIEALFPELSGRITRMIDGSTGERLRGLALDSIRSEFARLNPARRERRLFLFYLLNDQMRHLWDHYENVDLSRVEFETPFFDTDFLSTVTGSPVEWFLRHRLYNKWLGCFRTPVTSVPWQAYPGHEAGPLPLPNGVRMQWSKDWYSGREARRVGDVIVKRILTRNDPRVMYYVRRHRLAALRLLNLLGVSRFQYEIYVARRLDDAIAGAEQ